VRAPGSRGAVVAMDAEDRLAGRPGESPCRMMRLDTAGTRKFHLPGGYGSGPVP
jgi:hypothetical protein